RVRAGLPPPPRPRDELRRWPPRRAAQSRSRAHPLPDGGARAVPHRRRDVSRRRHLERQRAPLRHRGAGHDGLNGPGGRRRSVDSGWITMLRGSLPVGRYLGTTVRVHWSAFVVAGLLGLFLAEDLDLLLATAGVLGFFVAILLHEFA